MNNKKLYLAFLWHMHQPYYKDDVKNLTSMPWVFLHAIKDYYDMPWYLSQYPALKATFNLVPSLLEQIESYTDGTANDILLNILREDVNHLNEKQIEVLQEYLFLANSDHMIKPFRRYHALCMKYKDHQESLKGFSLQEIQEVQVLFLLSWCGNYLREKSDVVKMLIAQQENFTHLQKIKLLDTLFEFVVEIIPYYKALMRLEQIALSTTPFYHPILPLLLDRNSAKEARWDVVLPKTEANYTDFAQLHLQKAVAYFHDIFNQEPNGMWPSEGSVSLKTAQLMREYNVRWICSDEEILFKTLRNDDRRNLYKPYFLKNEKGEEINIFFRDRYLSDRIGFEYSKKTPKEAALDFISHLKSIYENYEDTSLVSVILDGENAWEFYANNGKDFFNELYRLLGEQTWCETIFFNEINKIDALKKVSLDTLSAGSWINGNFDIWIGHPEKNAAWELLDEAKVVYDKLKDTFEPDILEQIDKEFMVALGSDWFWWYGDDHFTSLKLHFDEEFRGHIRNIYQLMEKEPPHNLSVPIVTETKTEQNFFTQPTSTITPLIDGKINDFYEWFGSGTIDLKKELSTMDRSLVIEEIYYGTDLEKNIYFLFKIKNLKRITEQSTLKIYLNEKSYEMAIRHNSFKSFEDNVKIELGFDEVIEVKIEGLDRHTIEFAFELFDQDRVILQKFPLYETFMLHLHYHSLKRWNVTAGESKSEFRYCKLSKEWTLFAPERIKRPDDVNNKVKKRVHDNGESCPFDRGKEELTPKEIARIDEGHGGWKCRVVPNLYNALSIDGVPKSVKDKFFDKYTGFGVHEVLIETPIHDKQMWDYGFDDYYNYFSLLQKRVIGLQNDKRLACLSIFKNHAEGAGASLTHSHSQLIALPFVPKKFKDEIACKTAHYDTYKRALLDDMVYEEKEYQKNIVAENSDFIIYCPYASKFEFEAKVVAKKSLSSLVEFTPKDITALSDILKDFFKQFHSALGDVPFNMIIKNAPYENYNAKTKEYFRFHINILPRIYKNAGFELDSDIYINLILPENAAKIYKENV